MKNAFALFSLSALLLVGACGDVSSPLDPSAASLANGGGGNGGGGSLAPVNASINAVVTLKSAVQVGKNTVFTYEITSNPGSEQTRGPAISHWVLPFPDASVTPVIVASSELAVFGVDPTTGVRGIKFDTGYRDGETRTVTVTLGDSWATGSVSAAVKSGNGYKLFTTDGPTGFSAAAVQTYEISGVVYFDASHDGKRQIDAEPGVAGVVVRLGDQTQTTDVHGKYRFEGLTPAEYAVAHGGLTGLVNTAPATGAQTVAVTNEDENNVDFGLRLDLSALAGKTANGMSHGFWKSNIDKALKGTTKGVQVSKATLEAYMLSIATFALSPFDGFKLLEASKALNATGSNAVVLLEKQLIASELNYYNKAYIGGDEQLTRLFVWYGEYVSKNNTAFSAAEILALKNWFDAYNNTHGGALVAPAS